MSIIATIRIQNPSQYAIPAQSAATQPGRYDMTKAEIWIDPVHLDDRGKGDEGLTSAEVAASITTTNGRILSRIRLPKATRLQIDETEGCAEYGAWTREHLPIRALVPAKEFAKVVKGTKPLTIEIVQNGTGDGTRNSLTVRVRADGRHGGAVTEFGVQGGDEAEQTFPQCNAVIPSREDTEEVLTLDAEYLKKLLASCTRKGDRVDIRMKKTNGKVAPVTFEVRETKESKSPGFPDGGPIGFGIIMPISKA